MTVKCEKCHENEASVFIQRNINGVVSEQRLCASCARREMEGDTGSLEHLVGPMFSQSMPAGTFHILGGIPSFGASAAPAAATRTCPVCGTSYEDFRKTGLVGCASCYEAFADRMEQIFARVQASGRHTGRRYIRPEATIPSPGAAASEDAQPVSGNSATTDADALLRRRLEVQDLRSQLRQMIEKEDYEEAARLRDRIRDAETELKGKGESV